MSYGMICSLWQLFPAIQSQAKTNLLMADCLSTWLFHLCNKSGSNLSEVQRTRQQKLRILTRDLQWCTHAIKGMAYTIWHMPSNNCTVFVMRSCLWAIAQTTALLLCLPRCPVVTQGISMSFSYWTSCMCCESSNNAKAIWPHRGIGTYVLLVIPRWAEPRRHTVVGLCVYVCMYVCICLSVCWHAGFLLAHWKLSAETSNTSKSRYLLGNEL